MALDVKINAYFFRIVVAAMTKAICWLVKWKPNYCRTHIDRFLP